MLSYITAGESHGKCLVTIIQGLPAGIPLNPRLIQQALKRRRISAGRGPRMQRETDYFEIVTGIRRGKSIGAPITVLINNRTRIIDTIRPLIYPRPGHIDLAGAMKFGLKDGRDIAERASARDTAARVVAGTIAQMLLSHLQVEVFGYVTSIAGIQAIPQSGTLLNPTMLSKERQRSAFYLLNKSAEKEIVQKLNQAQTAGDTLGGVFEVIAFNVPVGLGNHTQWMDRLDSRLAAAVMAIPAVKSVEIGLGKGYADCPGSTVHDIIYTKKGGPVFNAGMGFTRLSNNAGGIEGGISNGENIVVRAVVKPIPTLKHPLPSINLKTGRKSQAQVESSDVCVVPAASVVGEAVIAFEIARVFLEKFGGDTLAEVRRNYHAYQSHLRKTYAK